MRRFSKFVVAYDKFKDCLKATELCNITKRALEKSLRVNSLNISTIPLADGGDGFLDCIEGAFLSNEKSNQPKDSLELFNKYNMSKVGLKVTGPLGSLVDTSYLLMRPKTELSLPTISFIEQALVSGLQMVPQPKRNPFNTTSKGIGEVILAAYKKGVREVYLGVGGSATVDFGIGAIHALGVPVYNIKGEKFPGEAILTGGDIKDISDIEYDKERKWLPGLKLKILTDVDNPLLGPNGAAYVYGKQKGARDEDLPVLESYMAKLARILEAKSNGRLHLEELPKMGAAGAISAGLSCFIQSEFHNGIKLIAEIAGLDKAIQNSDVIITGEGAFDTQTLEGKTVSHVIKLGKKYRKKLIVICGVNKVPKEITDKLEIDVYDLKSRFDTETCFKRTADCINKIVQDEVKPTLS